MKLLILAKLKMLHKYIDDSVDICLLAPATRNFCKNIFFEWFIICDVPVCNADALLHEEFDEFVASLYFKKPLFSSSVPL